MPNPENPRMTESAAKPRMPLHWKIGIGFFLGLVLGLIVYYTGLHEWTPVDLTSAACVAGEPAWYCAPVVEVIVHGITRPFGPGRPHLPFAKPARCQIRKTRAGTSRPPSHAFRCTGRSGSASSSASSLA